MDVGLETTCVGTAEAWIRVLRPGQGIVTPQGAETRFSVAPVGYAD